MKKELTLSRLKNTDFLKVYKDFILQQDSVEYSSILSLAVIFINSGDTYIQRLGYRIIVLYCNRTKDYRPLYEVSINLGLYPISKLITSFKENEAYLSSFFLEFNDSFTENYEYKGRYQSHEQKQLANFFERYVESPLAIVAPTSYGKTDLILTLLDKCKSKNICIITPTKSLLAQTKLRIAHANINWINKIITHPEMYNDTDENVVAVLTQERLLRLMQKDLDLSFDYVVIDEAHSLLGKGNREILLAIVAIILEKRNPNIAFKFLTPFLNEVSNLNISHTNFVNRGFGSFSVDEYIKTELFYTYDIKKNDGKLEIYDQFINDFFSIEEKIYVDDATFVEKKRAQKNIVYLNKPIDIEKFAEQLSAMRSESGAKKIEKACSDIAEHIHPRYNLIQHLKKGIIYHHGSVPDSIRLLIEHLYSTIDDINYVITSSTLLEGVNLPAERMFILDNRKGRGNLTPSSFKNLIGRVCRFGDIFKQENTDLKKLQPHIYVVNGNYCKKNANIHKFLKESAKVDKKVNDDPENVLLEKTLIDKENQMTLEMSERFIENYENNTIKPYNSDYAKTDIGKACFLNNVTEFNIFDVEEKLQSIVDLLQDEEKIIDDSEMLMELINRLFFQNIKDDKSDDANQNIGRLKNEPARNFYRMFLNWRIIGASYSEMIQSFLNNWENIIREGHETLVYVGRWGDKTRNGHRHLWTDIRYKNIDEKINLAIVRIKEEQDFLDNVIMKFVEVLNDLGFLEESFYNRIKYGTDDKRKITLIKNGFSLSLSSLIVDKYSSYLEIDVKNSMVHFKKEVIDIMEQGDENLVLMNEAKYFISDY